MLSARSRAGAQILPVLLLTLLLAGVLAYQANDAARSHRRVREAALRDYASFEAWELGRAVEADLSDALSAATTRPRRQSRNPNRSPSPRHSSHGRTPSELDA